MGKNVLKADIRLETRINNYVLNKIPVCFLKEVSIQVNASVSELGGY